MGTTSAWFALYTRHQHEKSVARLLSGKGVETFLPLYNAAHRWKDRVRRLSLPLFPNYLFVFAGLDQWGAILQVPGVYDFVRLSGSPAPMPAEEIETVRRVVERGLPAEPYLFLKSGDRVRLRTGPLEGIEGILVRKKNFYRLVISVELLVRSVAVEVDTVDIERVAEGSAAVPSHAASVTA
jgi:transcription termination/antitermination protein NusG